MSPAIVLNEVRWSLYAVRTQSLLRNSSYVMATTLVTAGFGFLFWIIAARTYSAHDVGLAATLVAVMTFAALLGNLGIGTMFVEALPRARDDEQWSTIVSVGLLLGLVLGACTGVVALWVMSALPGAFSTLPHHWTYQLTFVLGVTAWTVATLVDYLFIAERAAGNMLARNTIFVATRLPLLAVPAIASSAGSLALFQAWVGGTLLSLVAALALQLPRLDHRYRFRLAGFRAHAGDFLRSTVGHHLINIGSQLPMYVLPILVTARLSPTDNAYFYTTWTVCSVFFVVSPAVAAALFAEGSHDSTELAQKIRSAVKYIATLQIPPMLVFLAGGTLILSIFGDGYADHGHTLLLCLVASAIPDAITNVWVSVSRVDRQRLAVLLNVGMASICLVLTWVLLPSMGITAAGAAWLIAQTIGSIAVGLDVVIRRRRRHEIVMSA